MINHYIKNIFLQRDYYALHILILKFILTMARNKHNPRQCAIMEATNCCDVTHEYKIWYIGTNS